MEFGRALAQPLRQPEQRQLGPRCGASLRVRAQLAEHEAPAVGRIAHQLLQHGQDGGRAPRRPQLDPAQERRSVGVTGLGEEAGHLELRMDPRFQPPEQLEDGDVPEADRGVGLLRTGSGRPRCGQGPAMPVQGAGLPEHEGPILRLRPLSPVSNASSMPATTRSDSKPSITASWPTVRCEAGDAPHPAGRSRRPRRAPGQSVARRLLSGRRHAENGQGSVADGLRAGEQVFDCDSRRAGVLGRVPAAADQVGGKNILLQRAARIGPQAGDRKLREPVRGALAPDIGSGRSTHDRPRALTRTPAGTACAGMAFPRNATARAVGAQIGLAAQAGSPGGIRRQMAKGLWAGSSQMCWILPLQGNRVPFSRSSAMTVA